MLPPRSSPCFLPWSHSYAQATLSSCRCYCRPPQHISFLRDQSNHFDGRFCLPLTHSSILDLWIPTGSFVVSGFALLWPVENPSAKTCNSYPVLLNMSLVAKTHPICFIKYQTASDAFPAIVLPPTTVSIRFFPSNYSFSCSSIVTLLSEFLGVMMIILLISIFLVETADSFSCRSARHPLVDLIQIP